LKFTIPELNKNLDQFYKDSPPYKCPFQIMPEVAEIFMELDFFLISNPYPFYQHDIIYYKTTVGFVQLFLN